MSLINGSPLAGMNGNNAFAYEPTQNEPATQNQSMRPTNSWSDGFRPTPISLPIQSPGYGYGNTSGADPSASSDSNSFFSSIMQTLGNLMSQIAALLGQSSANTCAGTGYANAPTQNQPQENAFTNATATSWGDPHETFAGTTAGGASVNGSWDSMTSHGDLLDSDSFRGGYQVSTNTTTPSANGVTYNASATVTTHDGNAAVTLDKDGSYDVTENGRNVALAQGRTVQIGRDETVTLNADKSLTIVDTNRRGGSLTTTLSNNGNGVDVKASGTNVDLGGYLVNKTDRSVDPVAYGPVRYASDPFGYGSQTEPIGAGEIEFA